MSEGGGAEFLCVADTDGLYCIAAASGNLKTVLLDHLKSGHIGVPACAWKEFEDLYPDKAEALKPFVSVRITMKRAYYAGAARIADRLNSGFPRGAYDDSVELFTASIAFSKNCPIVTSPAQVSVYKSMTCKASDLETWVVEYVMG
ncbi:hypothetical protein [Bradyrhizobium sp. ORS 285]|nr:hypothetical protein [Bradyrhizobium sp. ORS 285]